ncbi:MAG: GatB/YqeY domain-containing protein [Candidatus Cloacimonetes bacterium]|nr:GatB/YqeY domain-containing protein [Candidatus Cloacimonadota bacterium]
MLVQINQDLKKAMQEKDKDTLKVLRALKSAVQYEKLDKKRELSEDELISVLKGQVKQREQASELYLQGNRPELSEIELQEIKIIKRYLPEELPEAVLEKEVKKAIAFLKAESMSEMGSVMKYLKEKLGNNVDGKTLSSLVRKELQN